MSASGPSRFRVSVVQSATTVSLAQPVVTSKDTSVQPVVVAVALKPIVCITESKDSGDAYTPEIDVDRAVESPQNGGTRLSLASCVAEEVPETTIPECSRVERSNGDETSIDATSRPLSDDDTSLEGTEGKVDASGKQLVSTTRTAEDGSPSNDTRDVGKVQMENNGSACTRMSDRSTIVSRDQDGTDRSATGCANESIELQTKHDPIQKGTSNLGRLLSLFQHSSCFFSDAASMGQLKSKGAGIQGSINSMMTLGDKFHYYIKDKKEKIYNREVEESTVSLKGKSKFFNVSQLPSLQSLASIIPSFRFDSSLNVPEQSSKSFCSKQVNLLLENNDGDDPSEAEDKCGEGGGRECENLNVYSEEENTDARAKNDPLLSKDTESKFPAGVTNKEVVLAANCIVSNIIDTCSKIVNDNLLMHASSGNTIVPVPKLLGIPEYSALRAARNDIRNRGTMAGILERVDPGPIKGTDNNKCLTDSINFTSDSSSLPRSVTCNAGNDTRTTVHTPDRMHNLVILNLSTKGSASSNSAFGVNNSARGGAACFLRDGGCVCNVNNKPDDCYSSNNTLNVKTNCLNNEVTKMYSIDSDSDRNVFISVRKMPSVETEEEAVDVNSSTKWNSTVVNDRTVAKMSNTSCACKDVGFEVRNGGSELCTPCRVVRAPTKRIALESSLAERGNECLNNSLENTSRNTNIVVSIPRMQYCTTNFNTFTLRNLVRHVADICIDGTLVERVSFRNVFKVRTLFYDVSQISDSLLNAVTEQPEEGDRQTEGNVSTGDCIEEDNNWQRTEDNDAPGIASGCSTLPVVHSRSDANCSKGNLNADGSSVENIPGIRNSGSDTTRRTKCTNSDDINRKSDEYLNTIKRAVGTTMCTTTTVANTRGDATVDVITEQNSNIAESSTVIHATR